MGNFVVLKRGDTGTDRYTIQLKNGWVIHRVVKKGFSGSSDLEEASFSNVPTSVNRASVKVEWLASPGDTVSYHMAISVVGPPGTSPV